MPYELKKMNVGAIDQPADVRIVGGQLVEFGG